MKNKLSTGYLTPQNKNKKPIRTRRLSGEICGKENSSSGFNEELFQQLLNCPEKKKLILQLIAENKSVINEYKQKHGLDNASPIVKIKSKNNHLESPTALSRRRALEKMNSSGTDLNNVVTTTSSQSSNTQSTVSESSSGSKQCIDKILTSVVAYVEINNSSNEDRSTGVKSLLKSMGAEIRDTFTRDVTHVIYKDGSYNTFKRAKQLKVHLVSVLWVKFCRKTLQRQREKHYPAMSSDCDDESLVCSQMQNKEYEDIIIDEYKRSLSQKTPLPSTQCIINRRRTLHTPSVTKLNETSSSFSFSTTQKNISSSIQQSHEIISDSNMDLTCISEFNFSLSRTETQKKTILERSISESFGSSSSSLDNLSTSKNIINNSTKSAPKKRTSPNTIYQTLCEMSALKIAENPNENSSLMSSLYISGDKNNKSNSVESFSINSVSEKTSPINAAKNETKVTILEDFELNDEIESSQNFINQELDDNSMIRKSDSSNKSLEKNIQYEEPSRFSSSEDSEIMSPQKAHGIFSGAEETRECSTAKNAKSSNVRLRKLYVPNESISLEVDDEKEREERRLEVERNRVVEIIGIDPTKFVKITLDVSSSDRSIDGEESPQKRPKKVIQHGQESVNVTQLKETQTICGNKNSPAKISKTAQIPSRRTSVRLQKNSQKSKSTKWVFSPVNRRSTLEFMPKTDLTQKKKSQNKTKKPASTIVCSKLHTEEVKVFKEIIKKLGRFIVEDTVSVRTTHLIVGESKRTINMLRGISRGCWILSMDWMQKSLEAGKWLVEEDFEVTDFSPAIQKSRLQREAFGSKYTLDVFATCPLIYVALSSIPPCAELKELIITCKGKITAIMKNAKIVVGQYVEAGNVICVNEKWVLDSITFYKKMPLENYLWQNQRPSFVV